MIADRNIGVPYLEIDIDRAATARYGVNVQDVQDVIEIAIGGRKITTTVEGRNAIPYGYGTTGNYVIPWIPWAMFWYLGLTVFKFP